jgi:hypothetical protein
MRVNEEYDDGSAWLGGVIEEELQKACDTKKEWLRAKALTPQVAARQS